MSAHPCRASSVLEDCDGDVHALRLLRGAQRRVQRLSAAKGHGALGIARVARTHTGTSDVEDERVASAHGGRGEDGESIYAALAQRREANRGRRREWVARHGVAHVWSHVPHTSVHSVHHTVGTRRRGYRPHETGWRRWQGGGAEILALRGIHAARTGRARTLVGKRGVPH